MFETLLRHEAAQQDQPAGGNRAKQPEQYNGIFKILTLLTVQPMSSTIWQQVRSRKPAKVRASSWQQYGLALASDQCGNTPSIRHSPWSQYGHVITHFKQNPVFLKVQLAAWYTESFQHKAIFFSLRWLPLSTGSVQTQQPAQPQRTQGAAEGLCSTADGALNREIPHLPGTGMPSPRWLRLHALPHLEYRSSRQKGGK